eukprot:14793164-Alexandrium_andersonii.AAC.1
MSASLVGSEMCIRDRASLVQPPGDRVPRDPALVQDHNGQHVCRSRSLEARTHAFELLLTPVLCCG